MLPLSSDSHRQVAQTPIALPPNAHTRMALQLQAELEAERQSRFQVPAPSSHATSRALPQPTQRTSCRCAAARFALMRGHVSLLASLSPTVQLQLKEELERLKASLSDLRRRSTTSVGCKCLPKR